MGKRGPTKLRGSRGSRVGNIERFDLMVPLPQTPGGASSLECKILVKEIRERLASIGFTHMALTHTVYGRPKPDDRADVAIPKSLWSTSEDTAKNNRTKKRKLNVTPSHSKGEDEANICVLRRLHVVLENQSDMGTYLSNGPQEDLLNEYDLVSICPTNEVTFQSACKSATMADIITLDYSSRGLKLPYRIRSADVRVATERDASFEIPIAPALLHLKQRKALVHACKELQNSSLATKPRIIVSSGDRLIDGSDAGALALRLPGDISNLCKTVMHFDATTACNVVGSAAMKTLQRGKERRLGQAGTIYNVSVVRTKDMLISKQAAQSRGKSKGVEEEHNHKVVKSKEEVGEDSSESDEHSDDGFIGL